MSVFSLLENARVVPALLPKDITGAAQDGDLVSMKNCERCYILIQQGAWAGGTSAVTVTQEQSASGSSNTAVAFTKKWEGVGYTSANDVLTEVAVVSNTFNLDTANEFHVIEITPDMLTDGYTHIRVRLGSPGSNADLVSATYILTGIKYAGAPDNIPTAIT